MHHFVVAFGNLSAVAMQRAMHFPPCPVLPAQEYMRRLVEFGAVYYCPIHPLPPQKSARDSPEGQQQLEDARAARLAGAARHGKHVCRRKALP